MELWFLFYRLLLPANRNTLIFLFSVLMPLISFPFLMVLAITFRSVLDTVVRMGILISFQVLPAFSCSILCWLWVVHIWPGCFEVFLLYLIYFFYKFLNHAYMLYFATFFLFIYWYNHMALVILWMWCIRFIDLCMVCHHYILGINSTWSFWCVAVSNLLVFCWGGFLHFCSSRLMF